MKNCRPTKITCRWLKEITFSISKIDEHISPITQCDNDVTLQWENYLIDNREKLMSCKVCQDILAYNIDYRDV
jgi:hypothetical protein